jgi:hypothetical protein
VEQPRSRPGPYRHRFTAAYVGLVLVFAGAALGGWRAHAAARPAPCVPLEASKDPIVTAIAFIQTAVERRDPAGAYGLVIQPLREGITCHEWASGAMPIRPFAPVDWERASYRVTAGGTGQLVLDVSLVTKTRPRKPTRFLLELRQVGRRWLVGFWDRSRNPAAAHSPSAP